MNNYNRKDSYYRKAKAAGYRSRAAYKLLELHERVGIIARGAKVVDLGCAPGGWLQVASRLTGTKGLVVGIDRLDTEPIGLSNVKILRGDITAPEAPEKLLETIGGKAGVILSDMAPDTSGVGFADHAKSVSLVQMAFRFALLALCEGGNFCAKVFEGPDLNELVSSMKPNFNKIRRIKPKSTRKGSRELYLVCSGFRF